MSVFVQFSKRKLFYIFSTIKIMYINQMSSFIIITLLSNCIYKDMIYVNCLQTYIACFFKCILFISPNRCNSHEKKLVTENGCKLWGPKYDSCTADKEYIYLVEVRQQYRKPYISYNTEKYILLVYVRVICILFFIFLHLNISLSSNLYYCLKTRPHLRIV